MQDFSYKKKKVEVQNSAAIDQNICQPSEQKTQLILFFKHTTNINTYTRMSTHHYEHTHAHPTHMNTFERLSRLDLEIHEVGHQERLDVDGDAASH
jgi:hypothetical protein